MRKQVTLGVIRLGLITNYHTAKEGYKFMNDLTKSRIIIKYSDY